MPSAIELATASLMLTRLSLLTPLRTLCCRRGYGFRSGLAWRTAALYPASARLSSVTRSVDSRLELAVNGTGDPSIVLARLNF